MDKNLILYIGIGVAFVILIVLIAALIVEKKKKAQSEQPIHKDYDPSIANDVNAPATTAAVENQTPASAPVVAEEPKVEPELNFASQPDMPQLSGEQPVANQTPVVEANPSADTTPIMDIPTTPVEQTTPASQVVNAEPVVVPTVPITSEPVVETPSFQNIGMVAEPLVEEPVVEEVKPVVEEVQPVVVETPVVVEEPHPEVAQTSEVQVLDNYEITLPEEQKAIEVSQNMNEKNIEKAPMFVTNMPVEEPVTVAPQPETVSIDVPDIEEIQ